MTQLRLDGVVAGAASGNRGVSVTLNVLEVEVSTVVGTARQRISVERGFQDRQVGICDPLETDIQAAGAELAVSRVTACRWNMTCGEDLDEPDLWPCVEVRHTTHRHGGLIIRPRDKDGRIFFLVTGTMPNYCVVGWTRSRMHGRTAIAGKTSGRCPRKT